MHKLLLISCLFALIAAPAMGATKATDQVMVLFIKMGPDGAIELQNKTYPKAWGQIKLDSKTKNKIVAINAQLDKSSGGIEKYRLSWIRVVDDEVQGYMFQGNRSSVWMVEPASRYNGNKDLFLNLSLDGNGGFACREGNPMD